MSRARRCSVHRVTSRPSRWTRPLLTARLPAIYGTREFAEAGGLIAYGVDVRALFRRSASYVHRILQGARPAELPMEAPTTFELVINLKTADALGIAIRPPLLRRPRPCRRP